MAALIGIQAGTLVTFPNSDNTLHHVYSFSPAKTFELPLYSGKRAPPVLFDTPGIVTLGCNIHDWMVAHVVVLDSPWHARSGDDGGVLLRAPPGEYMLRVWHERAHLGDLAALEGRSRAGERDALCDPSGMGSFRVVEWTVP